MCVVALLRQTFREKQKLVDHVWHIPGINAKSMNFLGFILKDQHIHIHMYIRFVSQSKVNEDSYFSLKPLGHISLDKGDLPNLIPFVLCPVFPAPSLHAVEEP